MFFKSFLQGVLSSYCSLCELQMVGDSLICENCYQRLPVIKNPCRLCGANLLDNTSHSLCLICVKKSLQYHQLITCFDYKKEIAELINQSKEGRNIRSTAIILQVLEKKLKNNEAFQKILFSKNKPYLLAMPTAKSRMIRRGFSLPQLMAKHLSKQFQLPLIKSSCIKTTFWAKKQSKLSREERLRTKHDYIIKQKIPNYLVVIDDVLSTGKTVSNLVKKINKDKKKRVDIIVFAKNQ